MDLKELNRLIADAIEGYEMAFGIDPPMPPRGVDGEFYVETINDCIKNKKPIDDEFDWYPDLPPDANT